MIPELITYIGVGILTFVFAFLLIKKQKINLVHSYHHKNVKEEDIPAYTRQMGIGLLLIGAGCIITGLINFFTKKQFGIIALVIASIAGLVVTNKAQKKYNGSWFS